MAGPRVGIRFEGEDYVSPTVKGIQTRMQALGVEAKKSILTGVGLAGGVSAFNLLQRAVGSATEFLGESISAAMEEESSIASLTAALKANVAGYDGNNAAIERVLSSRIKLGYADDQQRASLAALVAMTKDATAALQIQGIAMDAAAITGKDFESISIALGKAFTGNTAALKKLGIAVDSGTTGYELLAAVQKRFAGGAEAASNTTQGALKGMAAEFDELKEDIGKAFLPVITDLAKFARDQLVPALRNLTQTVKDAKPVWDGLGTVVGLVAKGLGVILAPVALAGDAIGTLSEKFDDGFSEMPVIVERGVNASKSMLKRGGDDMITYGEIIGASIPKATADGMLKAQQELANPINQLKEFIKAALSPAQVIARDAGFLASKELAAGLASNNPLVRAKAQELQAAARAELMNQAGYWTGGRNIGASWMNGIIAGIDARNWALLQEMYKIKQQLIGFSPPPKGPLHTIDIGGFNVGKAWAEGFSKGLGTYQIPGFTPSLLGIHAPTAGGGMSGGFGMTTRPWTSPGEVHIHIESGAYIDGPSVDLLANKIATRLRFAPGT